MSEKKSSGKKLSATGRTRNFATVVYPDSAPNDWINKLAELHVPVLVSPLHDRDVDPDGKLKKAHYHVLFMFESVKDFETQIKPIFELIGGVGRETINSSRGYARYLCHLDNPDKAQYLPQDVRAFGGADYSAVVHLPTDDMKMLKDVFNYIRVNQVFSLAELLDVCAEKYPDWFSMIAMSRAYIVDKYIKAVSWEQQVGYVRKLEIDVGEDVGEVLK